MGIRFPLPNGECGRFRCEYGRSIDRDGHIYMREGGLAIGKTPLPAGLTLRTEVPERACRENDGTVPGLRIERQVDALPDIAGPHPCPRIRYDGRGPFEE